jgi:hypothetical protein
MEEKIYSKTNFSGTGTAKEASLLVVRGDMATGSVNVSITEKGDVKSFGLEASFVDELMAALNKIRMKSGNDEDVKVKGEAPEGHVEEVGNWDPIARKWIPGSRKVEYLDVNEGIEE